MLLITRGRFLDSTHFAAGEPLKNQELDADAVKMSRHAERYPTKRAGDSKW
jgi:hypothetical protein